MELLAVTRYIPLIECVCSEACKAKIDEDLDISRTNRAVSGAIERDTRIYSDRIVVLCPVDDFESAEGA